jgi:hypothetical protein
MSGLRERVEKLRDEWADPWGRGPTLTKRDCAAELTRILDADPAASTADAPADTTLRVEAWVARLESAAGMGPRSAVAEHQRSLGVEGDHETRLREKRVSELVDLITEAAAFRDDAASSGDAADIPKPPEVMIEFFDLHTRSHWSDVDPWRWIACGCGWQGTDVHLTPDQWLAHRRDALLPLLRAHDAQAAAQARRDALNKARVAVREVEQEMANEHGPTSEGNRNWLTWVAFDRVCALLRDRAEQDTPDQANT